jgi:hypothetical protein
MRRSKRSAGGPSDFTTLKFRSATKSSAEKILFLPDDEQPKKDNPYRYS